MKFVLSYSGGKDSVLALYRAISAGHEPAALLTTCSAQEEHSHFHHIPLNLLQAAADSLAIPLWVVQTEGDCYASDFEEALSALKKQGVELCVFGDIDIQEHQDWCRARCARTGLQDYFPLWKVRRASLVAEFIELKFQALITVLDTSRMDRSYLGQTLSHDLTERLAQEGVDVCGENGEFHTFVVDGPLFHHRVLLEAGSPLEQGDYIRLPLKAKDL